MTPKTADHAALTLRRAAFLLPILLLTLVQLVLAAEVLGGIDGPLSLLLLVLFGLNAAWLSLNGWQVALGFLAHLSQRLAGTVPDLEMAAAGPIPRPTGASRTAVLMPVFNEEPGPVFAALEVMARSLARTGAQDIDLFVLSDSTDGAVAAEEARAHLALTARLARMSGAPRLYYRRRLRNVGRKAGNVADFCENWGSQYDFMVMLDADSLMTGECIRRLVALMEANPRLGLVQTVSHPTNRETLFARIQQFAARLYTPLSVRGLDFWQQGEGNYWGHNAIIRVRAFMAHCALPVLPGTAPLGGEILCHDVVEAALLARAGWEVRVLPLTAGTWEEMPANVIDFAGRDKRWCQGNLQHLRVIHADGFRWANRLHLANGIMSYVSSPIWLLFMLLSALDAGAGGQGLDLMTAGLAEPGPAADWLFGITLGLLFGPKLLSLAATLADRQARAAFGGTRRLLGSAFLEQVFSTLLAPAMMAFYTRFVISTLAGQVVAWNAQPRGDRAVGWGEAWRTHAGHVGLGAATGFGALLVGEGLVWWLSPIIAGLLASPAVTALSSRRTLGIGARRLGLFLTPDETRPEPELSDLRDRVAAGADLVPAVPPPVTPAPLPAPVRLAMRPQSLRRPDPALEPAEADQRP